MQQLVEHESCDGCDSWWDGGLWAVGLLRLSYLGHVTLVLYNHSPNPNLFVSLETKILPQNFWADRWLPLSVNPSYFPTMTAIGENLPLLHVKQYT